jgi:sialidase-1
MEDCLLLHGYVFPIPLLKVVIHRPSCVATIYSDDHGKTWKRGAIIADNSPGIS